MASALRDVVFVGPQFEDGELGESVPQHRLGIEVIDIGRPTGLVLKLLRRVALQDEYKTGRPSNVDHLYTEAMLRTPPNSPSSN